MRRRAQGLAILLALWLPACTAAPQDADAMATLDSFWGAIRRADAAAAMTYIAADAVFIESGRLETRAEYESNHLPADIAFEAQVKGQQASRQVTVQDEAAWIVTQTTYDGTFDGSPVNFVSAQLALLTRQDGRWQIRAIHWSSRRP
jgi:ketosteroid isomerase-like protein